MWNAVLNEECELTPSSAGVDVISLPDGATWLTDDSSPHLFVRKCDTDIYAKLMDWNQNKGGRGCVVIGNPGIGKL